ncbi:hypothetical protein CDAR_4671 [Caerostris darwini]|uniref:Uncharacterized protein n=1 Tax=Caerostris darwini TaxID=1538125 RepID=A0AAV4P389_9ARAC|nr:hypothetical protein CDAR_4671 [Caerostris darwini]
METKSEGNRFGRYYERTRKKVTEQKRSKKPKAQEMKKAKQRKENRLEREENKGVLAGLPPSQPEALTLHLKTELSRVKESGKWKEKEEKNERNMKKANTD